MTKFFTSETITAMDEIERALRGGKLLTYRELLVQLRGEQTRDPDVARALHELERRREVVAQGGGAGRRYRLAAGITRTTPRAGGSSLRSPIKEAQAERTRNEHRGS